MSKFDNEKLAVGKGSISIPGTFIKHPEHVSMTTDTAGESTTKKES